MTAQLNPIVLDTESPIPLYHQIKQNLRELIESESFPAEQPLPSERELAEAYGVNRLTVRQAIGGLVHEGFLIRRRGIGTFIAPPKLTQNMERVQGFSERVRESGRSSSSHVVSAETIPAPEPVARRLDLTAGTSVFKLVRLRYVDDEPVILETAFLPKAHFPGLGTVDFTRATLYQTLAERYDCKPVESEETLEPVILTDYEQDILQTEAGAPGMHVEAVTRDQTGRIIEYSSSVVRGDKCRYFFRINRSLAESA